MIEPASAINAPCDALSDLKLSGFFDEVKYGPCSILKDIYNAHLIETARIVRLSPARRIEGSLIQHNLLAVARRPDLDYAGGKFENARVSKIYSFSLFHLRPSSEMQVRVFSACRSGFEQL
jgi:hypothetical protein